jgi:hypothetical protein
MKPDFEALRAKRNESVRNSIQELATELGVPFHKLSSNFKPNSCYCACATHGPCEHTWDGEPYESEDGLEFSTTCSRCGMTSMSHDMRFLP